MAPRTRKRTRANSDSTVLNALQAMEETSPGVLQTNTAVTDAKQEKKAPESPTAKKLKLLDAYVTESPFPTFPHPTHAEAHIVHDLLAKAHGAVARPSLPPDASVNSAQTCGRSVNVIDALIGVILSQNTTGKNSSSAKRSLDSTFGRNKFAAMASAPVEDVVEAIRHGGLANKKGAMIHNLLHSIKQKHGDYSLQHLLSSSLSNDEVMKELISYNGVGPKSASCVLLFCLGRQSFAVDTHVFRLSKVLGWLPEKVKNDRVRGQAHLDLKIPDEIKYGLHVLLVRHGKSCKGCRSGGKADCILKDARKSFPQPVESESSS